MALKHRLLIARLIWIILGFVVFLVFLYLGRDIEIQKM